MDRLPLFPDTTRLRKGELFVGGCRLSALAEEYGTPLYLYDRATLDNAVSEYRRLLRAYYPAPSSITYAAKAGLCVALAHWTQRHQMAIDCTGEGEIGAAVAAGVPRERVLVHGVNKSPADLLAAARHAGVIVVDSLSELRRIIPLQGSAPRPELWLRLRPGLAVETHPHRQTGQAESKFGMSDSELLEVARQAHEHRLQITGLHFHLGSQFCDPAPLSTAIQRGVELAAQVGLGPHWHLSPGGGWGVAYHEDELPHPPLEDYLRRVCDEILAVCAAARMPLPHLHLEPGRSLVARAGVALYRVGTIKRPIHGDQRNWLLVDGGLSDNPRPALYGTRYTALPLANPDREPVERVWIAGPYCESGDVLIEDLPFPLIEEGELIAVPVSGAYQLSMASNYNGARRPAVVMVAGGQPTLMQRRETVEDLLRRDL
jgi:diaminopimelate decarboxylase